MGNGSGSRQPFRHGHGGWSDVPVPINTGAGRAQGSARQAPSRADLDPPANASRAAGVIPVRAISSFLSAMPHPGINQLALVENFLWDPTTWLDENPLIVGSTVPENMVYVFTDVFFYGQGPSSKLLGPSLRLPQAAFHGLLRFELKFNGRSPMEMEGSFYGIRDGVDLDRRSGWPFVDRAFGTQRSSGFGIYATENSQWEVRVVVDRIPRFPLTLVGVELHGFSLPHDLFKQKIADQAGNLA